MNSTLKASSINFFNFSTPQMRAFHMTWAAFFVCFFGWFGIAPMLSAVRQDLGLTTDQIVITNMCAVASCVIMRLIIGRMCDTVGPRKLYSGLLILGSLPVMLIGLCDDYVTFLIARIAIGCIGSSFVITQYHTSQMFAPNCVGLANAVTAGWGNSGAGATHFLMPVLMGSLALLAGSEALAWRWAMVVPGVLLLLIGIAYFFLTQDAPGGNYSDLRAKGLMEPAKKSGGSFWDAARDVRVWALFFIYGGCFGVELVIDSQIALYLKDSFSMSVTTAGLIGGLFGALGLFARPIGGWIADRVSWTGGLKARVMWLFVSMFAEGLALMVFSQVRDPLLLIVLLAVTGLFVHAACGATYAVVPFINKKSSGSVSGIVGAGGNAAAVSLMFLFKAQSVGITWSSAFFLMGAFVVLVSFAALAVRFSPQVEDEFRSAQSAALAERAKFATAEA